MVAIARLCLSALVCLAAALAAQVACAPAWAGSDDVPRFDRIPIYFVTDREQKRDTFGPNRKYVVNCKHDPFYGTAYVVVPNQNDLPVDAEMTRLGWKGTNKKELKFCDKDVIDGSDPKAAEEKFFATVKEAVARDADGQLFVFIHGMNNRFEEAAHKAARLAYQLKHPVVLYSWPSVGSLLSYHVDEGNVEWSLEHFREFIVRLNKYHVTGPGKLTVVAHSMGNRLVVWAAEPIIESDLYRRIFMVCPDLDNETFKHYSMRYAGQNVDGCLLLSHKDRALPFSQMFYGGYYRLGEAIDSFFSVVTNPGEIAEGASEFFGDPLSSRRKRQTDGGGAEPKSQVEVGRGAFRVIDFTEIDQGLLGHKIPYALVASLARDGHPGKGLKIVVGEPERPNLLGRLVRFSYDLISPPGKDPGQVERVVRDDSP